MRNRGGKEDQERSGEEKSRLGMGERERTEGGEGRMIENKRGED